MGGVGSAILSHIKERVDSEVTPLICNPKSQNNECVQREGYGGGGGGSKGILRYKDLN